MKKVAIYTTATCHYCQMTKEFLKQNQVVYEEYNVGRDAARRQEMIDKSGQLGVPVVAISGDDLPEEQIIIGFDQKGIKNALGL